jgi:hypothetical protein
MFLHLRTFLAHALVCKDRDSEIQKTEACC